MLLGGLVLEGFFAPSLLNCLEGMELPLELGFFLPFVMVEKSSWCTVFYYGLTDWSS